METLHQNLTPKQLDLLTLAIAGAANLLKTRFNDALTIPPDEVLKIFLLASVRLPAEIFKGACLRASQIGAGKFCRSSDDAWFVISELLLKELEKQNLADVPGSRNHPRTSDTQSGIPLERTKTILDRVSHKPAGDYKIPPRPGPELNPDLKNLPTYGLIKHYALVRKTSVFNFILEQSGSVTTARVHNFIQHKNDYKLSARGKVVYDGSFAWISRELGISTRTIGRAFAWMKSRKLVTKIGAEDHRIRRNSRWYVCTSMAQNLKLWSMAYRPQGR